MMLSQYVATEAYASMIIYDLGKNKALCCGLGGLLEQNTSFYRF